MLMLTRHPLFLRCVSLLTALTFLPTSVQAWHFLPQVQSAVFAAEEGPVPLAPDKVAELEAGAEAPAPLSDVQRLELTESETPIAESQDPAVPVLQSPEGTASPKATGAEPIVGLATLDEGALSQLISGGGTEPAEETSIPPIAQVTAPVVPQLDGKEGSPPVPRRRAAWAPEGVPQVVQARFTPSAQAPLFQAVLASPTAEAAPTVVPDAPPELAAALTNVQSLWQAGEGHDAWLAATQLADAYPNVHWADVLSAAAIADEIARTADSGALAAIENAIPGLWSSLVTAYGKERAARFYEVRAEELGGPEQGAGRSYLEVLREGHWRIVIEHPQDIIAHFKVRTFIATCAALGDTSVGNERIRDFANTASPTLAAWSSWLYLAENALREHNDPQARLYYANVLEVAQQGALDVILQDPAVKSTTKSARLYNLARALEYTGRVDEAFAQFYYIAENFTDPEERWGLTANVPALLSGLLVARHIAMANSSDPYQGVLAYDDFIRRYPGAALAGKAMLEMAGLYLGAGDYERAAHYYNLVIANYPGTEAATAAEQELAYVLENLFSSVEVATGPGVPQVPQDAKVAQNCGPWALKRLLAARGIEATLDELGALAGTDETGTTMLGLQQAAKEKGIALSGVVGASPEQLRTPFIAFVRGEHFFLVTGVEKEGVTVADLDRPEELVALDSFDAMWNGEALVVDNISNTESIAALPMGKTLMEQSRGGTDYDNGPAPPPPPCEGCDCPPPPPGSGVGGGGGGCDDDGPGEPHSPTASAGVRSPGVTPVINTLMTALNLTETDGRIDVIGPMYLSFDRTYMNEKGFHRAEYTSTAKPWMNNIGSGWTHRYNVHLRTSAGSPPTTVEYFDEAGTARTFNYSSTSGGYNWYYRSTTGTTGERGDVLKRNTTTLAYTLELVSGATYAFSSATGDAYRFCRLESIADLSGNAIALAYDGANGSGKLTKVSAPSGGERHFALAYAGSLLTKVELKSVSTLLATTGYAYNASNELTRVTDTSNNTVQYAYAADGSAAGSRYITAITDKKGATSSLAWTFTYYNGSYEAYKLEFTNAIGLKTVYDRSVTTSVCTITNWDGATNLSKIVNTPATGDPSRTATLDYYKDASNYERWSYLYNSTGDLTKTTEPGGVVEMQYSYNNLGRLSTLKMGASGPTESVAYAPGNLYATKITGVNGLDTFIHYDSSRRITKVVPPWAGSSGFSFVYDTYGAVTSTGTPLGHETLYEYDNLGNLTRMEDAEDADLALSYDALGNMTRFTDARGENWDLEYSYGGCGACGGGNLLTKNTDPLGNEEVYEYDVNELLTRATDTSGVASLYLYDVAGRLTAVESPEGSGKFSYYAYDKLDRATSATDTGGVATTVAYDHRGRVTSTTDPMGTTSVLFDSAGNLSAVTDGLYQTTQYKYDALGQMTGIEYANGKTESYFYDSALRMTKVGAGAGGTVDPVTYQFHPSTGQLSKIRYTDGVSTWDADYTYDGESRLTKLTDWLNNTDGLRYAYDATGRITSLTDYDDSSLAYVYDLAGNVLSMVDYHGNGTSYTYNALGQLSTLTAPGSKTWTYSYGAGGRLTRVDIPNGMHTLYAYDSEGRRTSLHHKDGGAVKQGFDYGFDTSDNITKISHEDGSYWEYAYDGRYRLTSAKRNNKSSPTIIASYEYTYDDGDNMLTKEVPWYDDFEDGNITGWSGHTGYYSVANGVMENTPYAPDWRDIYLSETGADYDVGYRFVRQTSSGTIAHRLRYTDNSNQLYIEIQPTTILLRQVDGGTLTTLGTLSTTVAQNTWYNLRAVLDGSSVKVWFGAEGASFDEVFSATTTELTTIRAAYFRASPNSEFAWDDIRLIAGTRSTVETFTYNNGNEQTAHAKNGVTTAMAYDSWGRLTSRDDGAHNATYAYRYGGQLYNVTSDFSSEGNVTYETGGDGKRRSRVAGPDETWYNYTMGFDVVSKENDSDGSTGALTMSSVVINPATSISFTLADLAGTTPASGAARYYAFDHLSTTRSVWNAAKAVLGRYGFDPYGGEYAYTGAALGSLAGAYTGKSWDATARLFHFPYRQYNPELSKWMQRDPLGIIDGPNLYLYVLSNPIVFVDPDGLSVLDVLDDIGRCLNGWPKRNPRHPGADGPLALPPSGWSAPFWPHPKSPREWRPVVKGHSKWTTIPSRIRNKIPHRWKPLRRVLGGLSKASPWITIADGTVAWWKITKCALQ